MNTLTNIALVFSHNPDKFWAGVFLLLLIGAIVYMSIILMIAIPGTMFTLVNTGEPHRLMRLLYLITITILLVTYCAFMIIASISILQ